MARVSKDLTLQYCTQGYFQRITKTRSSQGSDNPISFSQQIQIHYYCFVIAAAAFWVWYIVQNIKICTLSNKQKHVYGKGWLGRNFFLRNSVERLAIVLFPRNKELCGRALAFLFCLHWNDNINQGDIYYTIIHCGFCLLVLGAEGSEVNLQDITRGRYNRQTNRPYRVCTCFP